MCGIAGLVHHSKSHVVNSQSELQSRLQQMSQAIAHRGPDAMKIQSYVSHENQIHFVHRRLAIVDLTPTGVQPMSSSSGRYEIIFNGEIYNYLDLKKEIGPKNWRGTSDTEVLLEAIELWGLENTISKCHGMFAIALLDKSLGELLLVRDRMGEKPLYYYLKDQRLVFASEIEAVLQWPFIEKEKNYTALEQFLAYGYIPQDLSVYKDIHKLLPGTILKLSLQDWSVHSYRYYQLQDQLQDQLQKHSTYENNLSLESKTAELDLLLQKTIHNQMIADVKIGSFLSGGVDSSLVTAIVQQQSAKPVSSFTVGFQFDKYNEAPYAKKIAQHLRTDHTELIVDEKQCLSVVEKLSDIYGEPFADASQIPSLLISQLTRQHVTVCLTGDGGDEVFGGYNRYELVPRLNTVMQIPSALRWMAKSSGYQLKPQHWDLIAKKLSLNKKGVTGDRIYKLLEHFAAKDTWDLYQRLTRQWQSDDNLIISKSQNQSPQKNWGQQNIFKKYAEESWFQQLSLVEKMMFIDTVSYMVDDVLVKVDRATMRHSLESRAPFLDHKVIEWAWTLPISYKVSGSEKKIILRQLLKKYIPAELFERPKVGFSIPLEHWLRGPLKSWAGDLLSNDSTRQTGLDQWVNTPLIQQRWQEHLSGQKNHQYALWNILMLQQWLLREKSSV